MSWERWAVVGGVLLASVVLAKLVDRSLARRQLPPEAVTRYRVLKRSVVAGIVGIGALAALLAIPQVRTVAGAVLGSAAVVGLVVGFAAQSTLSNFVAGLLIAFTQPLRLGDRVEVGGRPGVVEEIGLNYTFIRLDDRRRLVIPNTRLASDTIVNSTIVSREKVAEIVVQLPLGTELARAVHLLEEEVAGEPESEVYVASLEGNASVVVRARVEDEDAARRLEHALRLRAHERLREAGVIG